MRAAPDNGRALRRIAPVALALVVLGAVASRAEPPAASFLSKVVWSTSPGLTRLTFHAGEPIEPLLVEQASKSIVRVDLTAVDGEDLPRSLDVGTPHVASVTRVPLSLGLLPPPVSARFLVRLGAAGEAFAVEEHADGFSLVVGERERVERLGGKAPATSAWVEAELARAELAGEPPAAGERIEPVTFVVAADAPVRLAPHSLAPVATRVAAGDVRVADARRGTWLHLLSGGWILHSLPPPRERPSVAVRPGGGGDPVLGTSTAEAPAAWSVVTLGTGLAVELRALRSKEAELVEPVARIFATPVRLAAVAYAARGSKQYGFRIPSKADRFKFQLPDGRQVGNLDPMDLPWIPGVEREDVETAFPTAQLTAGQQWTGLVVLPAEADLDDVESVAFEVGGTEHRLFRVPGSGDGVKE